MEKFNDIINSENLTLVDSLQHGAALASRCTRYSNSSSKSLATAFAS